MINHCSLYLIFPSTSIQSTKSNQLARKHGWAIASITQTEVHHVHRTYVQYLGAPSSHQYQWALDIDPNSTNLKLIILFKAPPLLRGNSYKLEYMLQARVLGCWLFWSWHAINSPRLYSCHSPRSLPVKVFAIIRATHAITSIADVLQTFPRWTKSCLCHSQSPRSSVKVKTRPPASETPRSESQPSNNKLRLNAIRFMKPPWTPGTLGPP